MPTDAPTRGSQAAAAAAVRVSAARASSVSVSVISTANSSPPRRNTESVARPMRLQRPRHLAQQVVTGGVAVAVVHRA